MPRSTATVVRGACFLAGALLLGLLNGCATPQTTAFLATPNDLPRRAELTDVPYYAQEDHQCGPATLAMALQAAGVAATPAQLTDEVYLPGREGSLQIEMLVATRRHGLIAYELAPSLNDLLEEVAAGTPVLVLQNLGLSWYTVWHYSVVIGYDLDRREIILRSGPERRQVLPMATFEHVWSRSNYWAMLALNPSRLPHTAVENHYVESALALEQSSQWRSAELAYTAALTRWPSNLTARMGLGNAAYRRGDFAAAEQAFLAATRVHPDAAAAFNNLADTQARQRRYRDALTAAAQAVRIGGPDQAVYTQTQREIKASCRAEHASSASPKAHALAKPSKKAKAAPAKKPAPTNAGALACEPYPPAATGARPGSPPALPGAH